MSDTVAARTIRDKSGMHIDTGDAVALPAGVDVDIPTWQVIEGRTEYDATVRVFGRPSVQVRVLRADLAAA